MVRNAERYGGDLSRVIVAGESAGANLVTSLSVATCYRRPEPWAQRVFDLNTVPLCTLPACGIFQVTDTERFWRRRKLPTIVRMVLQDIGGSYLGGLDPTPGLHDLVDPVLLLERGDPPDRPLPAFFIPVGTRDPLLDDTRRLKRALDALGATAEARYYSKEIHAFHAMVWRKRARQLWADQFAFLERNIPDAPTLAERSESAA
jgi:acetyl esterase